MSGTTNQPDLSALEQGLHGMSRKSPLPFVLVFQLLMAFHQLSQKEPRCPRNRLRHDLKNTLNLVRFSSPWGVQMI